MNKKEITFGESMIQLGAEITNVRSAKSNTKNNRKKESFSHSDVYNDGNDELFHYGYCNWFGPYGA